MSFNQGCPSSFPEGRAGDAPQCPTSNAPMDNDAVPPRFAPTSTDSEASKYASAKDLKFVQDDINDIFEILARMQRPQETPCTAAPSGTTADPLKEHPSKEEPPKEPSATQSIAAAVVAHAQLESELEKQYCAISSAPKKDPNSERATTSFVIIRNVGSENADHHTTIVAGGGFTPLYAEQISNTTKIDDRPMWIMEPFSKEGYICALKYYDRSSHLSNWLTASTFDGSAPTTDPWRSTPWQLIPVKKDVFKIKLLFDESYRVLALENGKVVLQQEKQDDKYQLWMFDSYC